MNRAKVIVVSILCVLGLTFFLVAYNLFAGEKDNGEIVSETPTAKVQDNFTYQEMMQYREANPNDFRTGRTKINVDEQNTVDTLLFRIADIENEGKAVDTIENEESAASDWKTYEPTAEPSPSERVQKAPKASGGGGRAVYETAHIIEAQEEILESNKATQANALPVQSQQRRRRDGFIDGRGKSAGKADLSGLQVVTMGDQFVEPGGVIKLRVTEPATVGGLDIPKNTVVYGSITQGQNRLNVSVSAIAVGNTATPANLSAYDASDGMAGLKITQQEVNNQQQSLANNVGDEVLRSTGIYGIPVIGSIGRGAKDLLTRNRGNRNGILVTDNYSLVLK